MIILPYSSNDELPPAVKGLSSELQTAWRKAFNSALTQYGKEDKAFATAWAQVNKMTRESQSLHPSFLRILNLFHNRYGNEKGWDKFEWFVHTNGLDVSKAYDPRVQFREAFTWAEPYIRFMKEDKGAKYYAIRALHAIVSLNNNNYEDYDKMQVAAISMNYRPLNLNHDHGRWVPYPRSRVEYAKAEDMCVELIVRVDNQDEYLQKQLDHDPSIPEKEWINHPSIEGRPLIGGSKEGYHFTALALLEKGYQLPGDPLSEILPIMWEGFHGGEVCLMVDGEKVCLECEAKLEETARTDSERAISHFNISPEEWDKLSPEQRQKYIDKLPPRGSAEASVEPAPDESTPQEGNKVEMNTGEINQGGAKCPNCGHIVNLDGIKIPSEVKCPNCGTAMQSRSEQTVETVNTPKGDTKNMDSNESLEEMAEKNTKIADLTSELVVKEKKIATLMSEISELKANLDEALEQVADGKRQSARIDDFKVKTGELTEDILEKNAKIESLEKEIEEQEKIIASKDVRYERLSKEHSAIKESFEGLKAENDSIRLERNDLSVKARASEEKTLNETRERSRIQMENASLLDDKRKLTSEISKLSEQIAIQAKKNMEQEKETSQLRESLRKSEEGHKEKLEEFQKTLNEAKKFHSWAWGKLKEAGYAVISE